MHRDIAAEVEKRPALPAAAEQRILDKWRVEFNRVRPHEALGGKTPAELYEHSARRHRKGRMAAPPYPPHVLVKCVAINGAIRHDGEQYFISRSLTGHDIGLDQLDALRWRVWFHHVDCGELEMMPQGIAHFVPRATPPTTNRRERHDARRRVPRGKSKRRRARADREHAAHTPAEPKVPPAA